MKKLKYLMACLIAIGSALVTVQVATVSSANAAGCGAYYNKIGSPVSRDAGNVIGGIHTWRMEVTTQDCDGYDHIAGITIRMDKENGRCSNGLPYGPKINQYEFNPNILAGWNPGQRNIECNGGQQVYNIAWVAPVGTNVTSGMTESNRCIGAVIQIDIRESGDVNDTVPSVCFNGL